MNKQQNNNSARELARQILKDGICDMNIARLIQMSQYGLKGNIKFSYKAVSVESMFNHISYNENNDVITFSVRESQFNDSIIFAYNTISIPVSAITEISGCEDETNPEEYLNIKIKMEDGITINIRILY